HVDDRFYRKCRCPLWVIGTDPRGLYHRRTLRTANWNVAEDERRKIEAGITDAPRVTVADSIEGWLSALRSAKRGDRTIRQVHGALAKILRAWCEQRGNVHLDSLTLPELDLFVAGWDYASTTHRARIDLLRSFFKFCVSRKWIAENPAAGLIKP